MSATANGYVIDAAGDEGVAIIPAPPSVIASIGSSCPSRDSVSAAIALVRAKQVAKSAIMRAEEQILQPRSRSVSSDQTSTSIATESSMKDKVAIVNEKVESENTVPIISVNRDKPLSVSKDKNSSLSSVKEVPSTSSELQELSMANTSLPQKPSFEQTQDLTSASKESLGGIPNPPSLDNFDGTADANTIDDVNAFLSRLGVGALHSKSNESNNSIDRLRMLTSSSSGASSEGMESKGSSIREVQLDAAEKNGEIEGIPSGDLRDPPSAFA